MARSAHPDAMRPHGRSRTRTAPPSLPGEFPFAGRYRTYTLFGATGVLYLLMGFVALRVVWALGSGRAAWAGVQRELANPAFVAFHLLCLAAVLFVGVRFFRLFPKAQPAKIGPAKPPPRDVIRALLYVAWIAVAGGFAFVLAGGIVR